MLIACSFAYFVNTLVMVCTVLDLTHHKSPLESTVAYQSPATNPPLLDLTTASLRASSPIWASETSLARSREARFARPNRRACSQATPLRMRGTCDGELLGQVSSLTNTSHFLIVDLTNRQQFSMVCTDSYRPI